MGPLILGKRRERSVGSSTVLLALGPHLQIDCPLNNLTNMLVNVYLEIDEMM